MDALIAVAIVGYAALTFLILGGALSRNSAALTLGLEALALLLLATNAWGLRTRIPVLRASNKLAAAGGWLALMVVGFVLLAIVTPPSKAAGTAAPVAAVGTATSEPVIEPTNQVTTTPIAALATVDVPTTVPAKPTAAPTPSTAVLLDSLDETWQRGDWPAVIPMLDTLYAVDPVAVDFTDKSTLPNIHWA
jgi:hypothetical protein